MNSIARASRLGFLLACIAATAGSQISAQTTSRGSQSLLASADGSVRINAVSNPVFPSTAERGVQTCVDMTDINSWDALDDSDNISLDINVSSGLTVVGVAWDVGIASNDESWLADASIFLSNSAGTADQNAIILSPGFQVESPGNQEFSSGGVVTLADESLPELEPNEDGIIRIQFFEGFDDFPDAVDSRWRNADAPTTCPGIWLELDDISEPEEPEIPDRIEPSSVPLDEPLVLLFLVLLVGGTATRYLSGRG